MEDAISGEQTIGDSLCVQCGRCSAGCPVAFETPHTPRKVIRFLQIGDLAGACRSPFLWACAMCRACSVRCPRGVDVAEIMVSLRRIGQSRGWVDRSRDLAFYRIFQQMVEKKGRVSELRLGLALRWRKLPLHPYKEALLAWKLWRKGRLG